MTTYLCRYGYDALDLLIGLEPLGQEKMQRFYRHQHLVTELQGCTSQSVFQTESQLLAEQRRDHDDVASRLLATDHQRSIQQLTHPPLRQVYSPYGHRRVESGLGSLLGFNGERGDPVTGHYLLGNGHRAFNPVLMRFNSPDSLSPFGRGGLNPYAYCLGDPVNFSDPTGHAGEPNWQSWMFVAMSALGLVSGAVGIYSARLSIRNAKVASSTASGTVSKHAKYAGMTGAVTGFVGAGTGFVRSSIAAADPDNSALDPLLAIMAAFSALSFAATATAVSFNFRAYRINRAEAVKVAYRGVKSGPFRNPQVSPPAAPGSPIPSAPLPSPGPIGFESFQVPTVRHRTDVNLNMGFDSQVENPGRAMKIRRSF
ncbi:RHS repeat-associated core domain-containing protein [Pseudomonas sp. Root562]|jgi:RHS repeat-associated protein|uniref:RHS repeat-associated core domain-containing protein n=1 Tax=Pseudomonas sp. Root562 TaxID=1736561 RepID=UPI0009E74C93|nr:RHS repeat-associated core domain-containing protein [Pseudomonas sp. Root562]